MTYKPEQLSADTDAHTAIVVARPAQAMLPKSGHMTTGHRLSSSGIPMFQRYALSSYALTLCTSRLGSADLPASPPPSAPGLRWIVKSELLAQAMLPVLLRFKGRPEVAGPPPPATRDI